MGARGDISRVQFLDKGFIHVIFVIKQGTYVEVDCITKPPFFLVYIRMNFR